MHWTISDTLLHLLLFCTHIITINNSVSAHGDIAKSANGADNIKPDYLNFDNKYYVENETYYSDKRQIIEEYFRQSATSVKSSVKDHKFYVNMSSVTTESVINVENIAQLSTRKDEGNLINSHSSLSPFTMS